MDLETTVSEITLALNIIMDPFSCSEKRKEAYQVCENIKSNTSLLVPCGLHLSSKDKPSIVRRFGLQLIEYCIKFEWNNLPPNDKLHLKNSILHIVTTGTDHLLSEYVYIKDLLSRLVVEMIKREWPQQWPDMLHELNSICLAGETQTELVLLIFLRLAEDVVLLPCLPNKRRRDIQQTLTMHLKDILNFFFNTITNNFQSYTQLIHSGSEDNKQKVLVNGHLIEAALKTLAAFVEWIPWSHITNDDNFLLKLLYSFLGHDQFRLLAVECLLLITERKGKVEDRKPLLVLFSDDAMSIIFSAASLASNSALLNESNYHFFKRLCQLLVNLGMQLVSLWGAADDITEPVTFKVYLDSILTFVQHPSLCLSQCTIGIWIAFLQHWVISDNVHVRHLLPNLIIVVFDKLLKVGFPSKHDSPICDYSRIDFDSDEDYLNYYQKFRSNLLQVIKCATKILPLTTFSYGEQMLKKLLESSGSNSISPIQIERVASYLDAVCSRLQYDNNLELCPSGGELLKKVLNYESEDPDIMSELLSCMSTLFVFLKSNAELMPKILDNLFRFCVCPIPDNKPESDVKAVKALRKHAAASIVRTCINHSALLMPVFPQMVSLVKELHPHQLYPYERNLLVEALVIMSNEFKDYQKQSAFLTEILTEMNTLWTDLKRHFSCTESFISYVGLRELADSEMKGNNRSQINYIMGLTAAVVRRSKCPAELNIAERGGFCVKDDNSIDCVRNSASLFVLPHIDGIVCFIKCIHSLYDPSVLSLIPDELKPVLNIPAGERAYILGDYIHESSTESEEKGPSAKMNNFMYFAYETALQILGNATQFLNYEFYSLPNLLVVIKDFILSSIEFLPNYRVRCLFHCFLKPFFNNCPSSKSNLAVSILQVIAPFIFQKLSSLWQKFNEKYGANASYENEMSETEEIFEDRLNRILTREYLDILSGLLRGRGSVDQPANAMDEESEVNIQNHSSSGEKMSALGVSMLKTKGLGTVLVYTCFNALQWLDTIASHKSYFLCCVIFDKLKEDNLITSEDEVVFLLISSLSALFDLGEHEPNQSCLVSLAFNIYESMRPSFPGLQNLLLQLTGSTLQNLEKLDAMILNAPKSMSEKKKRDFFKNVISNIIGKNVGQQFKNNVKIKNLPSLFVQRPPKQCVMDQTDDLGICSLFCPRNC